MRIKRIGSSLKICLVAEGEADIYPRLGFTVEWDTGAAHIITHEAGFSLNKYNNSVFKKHIYNKKNY
jgi:3'(2'), 5'-bisphosphate nucleotidase